MTLAQSSDDQEAVLEILRLIGRPELAVIVLIGLFFGVLVALFFLWRAFRAHQDEVVGWAEYALRRLASIPAVRRLRTEFPGVWRFLAKRFSPGEYLGLHLTLGLLLSGVALVAFTVVANDVVERKDITRFDQRLAWILHERATPGGLAFFRAVSDAASIPVVLAVGAAGAILLSILRRWHPLAGWLTALGGAAILTVGLKHTFARPRPDFAQPFPAEFVWSFPSGHAMGALVVYGMAAYLLARWLKGTLSRLLLVGIAGALGLLIGFSRLYLGVHYFSDVLAGYAIGLVWLAVCATGVELALHRRRSRGYAPGGPDVRHDPSKVA